MTATDGGWKWPRTIAHIDMDAFFVSVELLRRPELRGKPVVVAGSGPRSVVTTASYEVRRFGVGSAMATSRAHRLCPQGIFLRPDLAYYREMGRRWLALADELGVPRQRVSVDEAYLDISTLAGPPATMRRLVERIRCELGLESSVGIGPNKLVAKVASDAEKPRGFVVLTRMQACERFAGEPVSLLPGIGPKTTERLAAIGVKTIAELRRRTEGELVELFGDHRGRGLWRCSRFISDDPVVEEPRKSMSAEDTFDRDIGDREHMHAELARLGNRLAAQLRDRELAGRTISIKVRLADFTPATRAKTLPEATNSPQAIKRVAAELLDTYGPPAAVRLLGGRVSGFADGRADDVAAPEPETPLPQQLTLL